jgi:ureidoglycolate lyase
MKLVRYGKPGFEKPAILDDKGQLRDLSEEISDIDGTTLSAVKLDFIRKININSLAIIKANPRIGPCVGKVGKLICIGLNYKDHAAEVQMKLPSEPIIFLKATSAICGPYDDTVIPRHSTKTDWEVELGVVIGEPAKYVSEVDALKYVAGYCVVNDISERDFQLNRGGQWDKGKGCDTFAPIGPWLVTRDEIEDPQHLSLRLSVDGHVYQQGNTQDMVFNVAKLVSYASQFFTLQPGDIISTGTPSGVGLSQKPEPVFLKNGQVVELAIDGLGSQQHAVIDDVQ